MIESTSVVDISRRPVGFDKWQRDAQLEEAPSNLDDMAYMQCNQGPTA